MTACRGPCGERLSCVIARSPRGDAACVALGNIRHDGRLLALVPAAFGVHLCGGGSTRFSAVIDRKPPIQEPSAANSTYVQFDV